MPEESTMSTTFIPTCLAAGTLTTEHAASSYGQPVLVVAGQAYGQQDQIDLGPEALDFLRYPTAAEHVAGWHAAHMDECRRLPVEEYNLIAKFIGLPVALA
jgi:hypothetical protein